MVCEGIQRSWPVFVDDERHFDRVSKIDGSRIFVELLGIERSVEQMWGVKSRTFTLSVLDAFTR